MKMTVVPAQVTTVEDRIIGSLGFFQILLLITPVFASATFFILLPPFMAMVPYKYILLALITPVFTVLAVRIKGRIIALWLVTILRYALRPTYYLYNKNVTTCREEYPVSTSAPVALAAPVNRPSTRPTQPPLDIPTIARLRAAIDHPNANFRLETGKKGVIHVRFTKVQDES